MIPKIYYYIIIIIIFSLYLLFHYSLGPSISKPLLTTQNDFISIQQSQCESDQAKLKVANNEINRLKAQIKASHSPSIDKKHDKYWLNILIPTIPRPNNIDYLSITLNYILSQLPTDLDDPMFGKIQIHIRNTHPEEVHEVFENVKEKFSNHFFNQILFFDSKSPTDGKIQSPKTLSKNRPEGPNRPNERVKRQTLDIAQFLNDVAFSSTYTLLIEDDFQLCDNSIHAIHYMINRAHEMAENWSVIRISYGMNGIIIHNNEDIKHLSNYLKKHSGRRPPDHLVVEWYAAETPQSYDYIRDRVHFTFKYNLLNHFGDVSSIHKNLQKGFSRCFETLLFPILFEVDQFDMKNCKNDDMSPCKNNLKNKNVRIGWKNNCD